MINAFVQAVATGRDKPAAPTDKPHAPPYYDTTIEIARLEFEAKKFEKDIRLRWEETEHHERIRQEELTLKKEELDRRAQLKLEEDRATNALDAQERQRLWNKARGRGENECRN